MDMQNEIGGLEAMEMATCSIHHVNMYCKMTAFIAVCCIKDLMLFALPGGRMILTPAKSGLNMKIARKAVAVLNALWLSGWAMLRQQWCQIAMPPKHLNLVLRHLDLVESLEPDLRNVGMRVGTEDLPFDDEFCSQLWNNCRRLKSTEITITCNCWCWWGVVRQILILMRIWATVIYRSLSKTAIFARGQLLTLQGWILGSQV